MREGDLLGGRYCLVERIGFGGMGEVWRCDDTRLERTVALKVLRSDLVDDVEFRDRFEQEARTLAALNAPGTVKLHDYASDERDGESISYLVMEYVPGQTLSRLTRERGHWDFGQLLPVLATVAYSLDVAHQAGIIHRDIKPSNIIVGDDGRVTLVDFGIAYSAQHTRHTASGQIMGTLNYTAPEQLQGAEPSPQSDVYSLGAVAFECLSGQAPFQGTTGAIVTGHLHEPPPDLPDQVPSTVGEVVKRALAKAPQHRFASAAEFAQACEAAAQQSTSEAPQATPSPAIAPTVKRPLWRRGGFVATAVTALVLVIAASVALFAFSADDDATLANGGHKSEPSPPAMKGLSKGELIDSSKGVIYNVDSDGALRWYRHTDPKSGSPSWDPDSGRKVDTDWNDRTTSAGCDGVLYSIDSDGKLYWYQHEDTKGGKNKWAPESGSVISKDFGDYKQLFVNSDGTLYGVNSNGNLMWFRHTSPKDGPVKWDKRSGMMVSDGWTDSKAIMKSGCNSVFYVVRPDGALAWYKHLDPKGGEWKWDSANIGSGWDEFDSFTSSDSGVIYVRSPKGKLYWFRHLAPDTGAADWNRQEGEQLTR